MAAIHASAKPAAFDSELRKLALVVVAGAIMTILDVTIVNVAITPLGRDLHASLSTIQWVVTGYTLALSMAIAVTGWAVERFGARTTWIASLLMFITGSVLCGAAWNITSLIVFRILQGAGGGLIMPVGQIMLARKAGPDRMARVMSVVAVPAMLGPVFGPALGGLIVDDLSWRWLFYVNVPLCAIAVLLAVKMLPPDTDRARARIDRIGLALLPPGLAFLVYGLSKAGSDSTQLWIWLAAGAAFTLAFVVHALRTDAPLVSVRAFARRPFGMSAAAMVIYGGAIFGFMIVIPVYFQVVRGESPVAAGLMMAPMGAGAIITMALSGRLADKIAARWIVIAGMLVVAAGAVAFTQIQAGTSLGLLAAAMFVVGLGHGAVLPRRWARLTRACPSRRSPRPPRPSTLSSGSDPRSAPQCSRSSCSRRSATTFPAPAAACPARRPCTAPGSAFSVSSPARSG
jgi:EmrB/QacA subfamily drug resistance transporter